MIVHSAKVYFYLNYQEKLYKVFKNTLVDVILKPAISHHHLRHTLIKQITKVGIQSRPILPIACKSGIKLCTIF